ncbi:hypothetical protein, partial [Aeromonas veronii]|uniref:hypothetical protein n=1 Tax=Aeromonas veronii TaxID=654 RepID=UPI00195D6E72
CPMRCCRIKLALFYASPSINLVNSRAFYLVFIGIYEPDTLKRQRSQLDLFGHSHSSHFYPFKNMQVDSFKSRVDIVSIFKTHI